MELLLIRHGLPVARRRQRRPPLAPEGEDQARRVAQRLVGEPMDADGLHQVRRAIAGPAEPRFRRGGGQRALELRRNGVVEYDRGGGT